MNQNFYFLRQLAEALKNQIVGLKLMECFSQERDELVLVLAEARSKHSFYKPFFIRVSLKPDFACLNFPDAFNRARHNSVDLFEPLTDLTITDVRQFENERAFGLVFNNFCLVFKLFGNRSNILLFENENVINIFHNKLVADNAIVLSTLDRPLQQDFEAFLAANGDHRKLFPTFGKEVNEYLQRKFANLEPVETQVLEIETQTLESSNAKRWQIIQETLELLKKPTFYITNFNFAPTLSLLPIGDVQKTFGSPIEAINEFYNLYQRTHVLDKEKAEVLRLLHKKMQRTDQYIADTYQKLQTLDQTTKNEELGHIIMANLHQIAERAEQVELFDFYRNTTIKIKLKAELSPQKNAENYYRKSKNERIEIQKLEENLGLRENELTEMKEYLAHIETIESVRELRKFLKNNSINTQNIEQSAAKLFKNVEYDGFVILIGKNAKNNDLLTKYHAYKEDLWLHARDVAGSHVIIKYKSGKKFTNNVIERAAQLAAWYSKRRTDSLCPVIVTPKKYVRKPKGLPDGEVVVDKEEVIMVEPQGFREG